MLQLQGLVEGLVPVRETISDRSTGTYDDLLAAIDLAVSGLQVDSIALYAKGARTGYRSVLPFLAAHQTSHGAPAGPGALRRLTDHLHSRQVNVGALVQIHRYDLTAWGQDTVWARDERSEANQALAAADAAEFRRRLRQTIHEIVTLFPDLDFLFLEIEPYTAGVLSGPLRAWLSAKGLSFEALADDLTYDPETARTTSGLGIKLDPTWSTEGLAFGVDYTRAALEAAEDTFDDADWKGIRGVVYTADGPAGRYVPVAVNGGWWLVPRLVVRSEGPKAAARRRALRQHLLHVREQEKSVCALLELAIAESAAAVGEARDIAAVARQELDGLLVAVPGGRLPQETVHRLKDEGLFSSRT